MKPKKTVKSRLLPKHKPTVKPLHQRILGPAQSELDTIDDLELELEQAYKLDIIEYDDYLKCWQVLERRREKAQRTLDKALGKSTSSVEIKVKAGPEKRPWKPWQYKLAAVIVLLILSKFTI